ncbi:DUF6602 domain-containing protein [Nodosilinea nodulosa]|uniref:DUF6602 domain-containing protein n=1 Tax=Nodosilinea nodulosa TaxID=416001 RepID=UPI0012D73534|nr:DUF6602 domain-containing protein [Nodosilinea nodulosa]
MPNERLVQRFSIVQKQFQLKLEEIRSTHQHQGNKGSNVEQIIRDFLRAYFPLDHRIGQGEVIDSGGEISSQLDIIMTNSYHPYINDLSQPSIYFIEGVACCGEVKSVLASKDIEAILSNCLRYKKLSLQLSKGMTIHSNLSDIKRFVEKRPYFLFAFESQINLDSMLKRISEFNKKHDLEVWQQIDAVFLLDRGEIINFGDGRGAFQFKDLQGQSIAGLIKRSIDEEPNLLFSFMTWMSAVIPRFTIYDNILVYYLMKGKMG